MGIHTALDTNGFYGARLTDAELEQIDLVLLDIKAWSAERHMALTGMENAPTLEFARRLAHAGARCGCATSSSPALTDDEDDIAQLARFAATLGNVERVDVLPFHQMGQYKWAQLGLPYTLARDRAADERLVQRTLDAFHREGLIAY